MLADYWDGHMMDGGAAWAWMALVMILAVVAAVLVMSVVVRSTHLPHPPTEPTARDILAERYARGGIDTAEYEERLGKLR